MATFNFDDKKGMIYSTDGRIAIRTSAYNAIKISNSDPTTYYFKLVNGCAYYLGNKTDDYIRDRFWTNKSLHSSSASFNLPSTDSYIYDCKHSSELIYWNSDSENLFDLTIIVYRNDGTELTGLDVARIPTVITIEPVSSNFIFKNRSLENGKVKEVSSDARGFKMEKAFGWDNTYFLYCVPNNYIVKTKESSTVSGNYEVYDNLSSDFTLSNNNKGYISSNQYGPVSHFPDGYNIGNCVSRGTVPAGAAGTFVFKNETGGDKIIAVDNQVELDISSPPIPLSNPSCGVNTGNDMEVIPDWGDYGIYPNSIYKLTPGKKIEITSTLTDGSEDRCLKAFYFKPWSPYDYIPEFDQFASQLITNDDGSYSIDQSRVDEESGVILISGQDKMHCDYLELWDEAVGDYEFVVDSAGTFNIPSDGAYEYIFFYCVGIDDAEFVTNFDFAVKDE